MLMVCSTQGCISDEEPEGPSLKVGDALPVFSIEMNNGTNVSTSDLKGKVPVIVFFNTECKDCQKELPIIQQLWEQYNGDSRVCILPISREESASEIAGYWKEEGFTMPYSAQEDRTVYSLFAPSIIPRIYIADTKGVITFSSGDTDMPNLDTLIKAIERALSI